jgi:hypothetical protein
MGKYSRMILVLFSLSLILTFPTVSAVTIDDSEDVDIDTYITEEIKFKDGEAIDIDITITADPDPISVFFIKGEEEYERFKSTEEIDIDKILAGEEVPQTNSTFLVVGALSMKNTTFFEGSLKIGEKDTYFLVIVIHRTEDMSKEEILSRASRVNYILKYEIEEKNVPYYLIPIAVIIFLIGLGLIVFYVRSVRKESSDLPEPRRMEPERTRRPPPLG